VFSLISRPIPCSHIKRRSVNDNLLRIIMLRYCRVSGQVDQTTN
jgi:hypothetical protein